MDASPTEALNWGKFLVDSFGPGGAVLALVCGAEAWWIRQQSKDCREERTALVAQIKDSEKLRREDGFAQWAKVDNALDRMGDAVGSINKTINSLQLTLASKGIQS